MYLVLRALDTVEDDMGIDESLKRRMLGEWPIVVARHGNAWVIVRD